jgi:regulator of CtrA degradation
MERLQAEGALVQLSERFTNSAAFGVLFREGMDLVEETAAYLDGAGRTEAKALDRAVSLTYATESMRLTTRLMQLASWLLLHRAVKEGEMIHRSMSLQTRVRRLDTTIHTPPVEYVAIGNPLVPQLNALKAAFER